MHLHVVFTYQPTFYSQIFSQHIFRLNFQTYCIRSSQDSEPVKYAKKCPIINQSENKMPTSSQSHVTDLISFLTHIWHAQLEWFHCLQYLCQDRCFRQPWTKMEKDHVSQMGETEIKWQSWAELVPWTLWKLTFNFPFHSKRFRPFRAIFIDKKQFFGQQPCDISKVWRALKTPQSGLWSPFTKFTAPVIYLLAIWHFGRCKAFDHWIGRRTAIWTPIMIAALFAARNVSVSHFIKDHLRCFVFFNEKYFHQTLWQMLVWMLKHGVKRNLWINGPK